MPEERVRLKNGIELCYETFGNAKDPAVLFVMGLGAQLLHWPEKTLLEPIASKGFYCIRFDNRDAGKSTFLHKLGTPSTIRRFLLKNAIVAWRVVFPLIVACFLAGYACGALESLNWPVLTCLVLCACFCPFSDPVAPYTLNDMGDDAVELLTLLHVEKAHVVGTSMGGMIAQCIALDHPERVLSLTSIMSTTGSTSPFLKAPLWFLLKMFVMRKPPHVSDIEGCVKFSSETWDTLNYPGSTFNGGLDNMEGARRTVQRQPDRRGVPRQLAAIDCAPPRDTGLSTLRIPVLIAHGEWDKLVPVANAHHMKKCIPAKQY